MPVLAGDGSLMTSFACIAREFNSYFSGVFIVENVSHIHEPVVVYDGPDTLEEIVFTPAEVEAKLVELDPTKVPGPAD